MSKTLRQKYKNAAHFKISSNAEIVPNEAYTLSPSAKADIMTLAKLKDPSAIKQGKLWFSVVKLSFCILFLNTLSDLQWTFEELTFVNKTKISFSKT